MLKFIVFYINVDIYDAQERYTYIYIVREREVACEKLKLKKKKTIYCVCYACIDHFKRN